MFPEVEYANPTWLEIELNGLHAQSEPSKQLGERPETAHSNEPFFLCPTYFILDAIEKIEYL